MSKVNDNYEYDLSGHEEIKKSSYQNPVPHLGGKRFLVHLSFDFKDWIEIEEAKQNIEEYFKRNGIPDGAICNITSMKEYK